MIIMKKPASLQDLQSYLQNSEREAIVHSAFEKDGSLKKNRYYRP